MHKLWAGITLGFGLSMIACDSGKSPVPVATPKVTPQKPAQFTKNISHTVVAKNAIQPQVAVDQAGTIYIAFLQRGNIAVCKSTDKGNTFTKPVIAMDVSGKARGGRQRGPRIGVDGNKTIYVTAPVTFDRNEWKKRYPRADLYMAASTDGGATWTKAKRVNEVVKQAPEALHWLAVGADGAYVAWLDMRARKKRGQDIFFAKLTSGNVSKNRSIAQTVCECCAPGLAVDAKGNTFFAYREGGDKGSREVYLRYSIDKGVTFNKSIQINQKPTQEFG